ncbi:hypothetical protein FQR65_LT05751 [Abscondita terminalis]|nr:hypothetical protein FQR65_LT05751 [Abscondita terminalis]
MFLKIYFPRFRQYYAAISVSFGMFITGLVIGWTGNNTDTLLAGKYNNITITDKDLGWITSIPTLAPIIFLFPVGLLCDVVGRKPTLLFVSVCGTVGWILIAFAKSSTLLFVGRFVTGIGSGSYLFLIPIYSVEIAEKDIRAKLGSFGSLLSQCGILFSFVMAYVVEMKLLTIVCATISAVYLIGLLFQDESPTFKIKKNDVYSAKKILLRLRKESYDVDAEINEIKDNLIHESKRNIKEALSKRSSRIATVISCTMNCFQHLGGTTVLILYANDIFSSAQAFLNPKHASIIVGVLQVLAAMIASTIIEFFRRRVLLITSFFLTSIGLIILGIYFTLKDRGLTSDELSSTLGFMPLLGFTIFTLMDAVGISPVLNILSAELYPVEIKGMATSILSVHSWIMVFLVSQLYGDLKSAVGSDVTFYIFAGVCFLGSVFSYLTVPETKNKSLKQIQFELNNKQSLDNS